MRGLLSLQWESPLTNHNACYTPFSREYLEETDDSYEFECVCSSIMVCRTHLVALAALLVAAFVKPWAILFGICAILGMVSFFACLILRVTKGYNNPVPRPVGSPLTTIFRVLFAAFSKSFYPRPRDMNNLYEASDPNQQLLPHTKNLR